MPCRVFFFRSGRSPTLQEDSPTKVGAQFLRHQLRAKARSMKSCVLHLVPISRGEGKQVKFKSPFFSP